MTRHGIEPNAVIYTSLIGGLASAGQPTRAFALYRNMLEAGIQPTAITFNSIIDMVARSVTDLSEIEELLNDMVMDATTRTDVSSCDILLKASCKSGNLDNAIHVFKRLRSRGVVFDHSGFVVLLQACARGDRAAEVDVVLGDMQQLGMRPPPNAVASALIKLFGRMKLPSRAEAVLDFIERGSGERPSLQVYTCVMQVYMQNRQLPQSLQIFDRMLHQNIEPDAITYSTVINGCIYLRRFECAMSLIRHACTSLNQFSMPAKHTFPCSSVSDDCRFVLNMRPLLRPVSLQAEVLRILLSAMHQSKQYALAQELSDLMRSL
jgi:leucine-rich PPR motif-containing protein